MTLIANDFSVASWDANQAVSGPPARQLSVALSNRVAATLNSRLPFILGHIPGGEIELRMFVEDRNRSFRSSLDPDPPPPKKAAAVLPGATTAQGTATDDILKNGVNTRVEGEK